MFKKYNSKKNQIKISSIFYLSLSIYIIIGLATFLKLNGNIHLINADFHFYNDFIVKNFSENISNLSLDLHQYSNRSQNSNWEPSPFYSLVFISPITFAGSQFLQFILGITIGISIIINIKKILKKVNIEISKKQEIIFYFLICLDFNFIIDSISSSTMSVALAFILFGFSSDQKLIKIICFCLAALIRPNYIFYLMSLFFSCLIFRPKGSKKLFIILLPSIFCYFLMYFYYYSSYPGSLINYIFLPLGEGIDYIKPWLGKSNFFPNINSESKFSFSTLIKAFSNIQDIHIVISIWSLKFFNTMGFINEKLFNSEFNFWFTKLWRLIYSLFIYIPSFFSTLLLILSNKVHKLEKSIYFGIIFYTLLSSLFIGSHRYILGASFLMMISLFRIFNLITLTKKSLNTSNLSKI